MNINFQEGNLDSMEYPSLFFDAIISIDTLYMPNDLGATLRRMINLLKSDGRMAIFYTHNLWTNGSRETLKSQNTPLGIALNEAGLTFQTVDFSEQTYRLMQLKRKIGTEMKLLFQSEGNLPLYEYIINESEGSLSAYNPNTCNFVRYLYQVKL
jgi:hypothetical protein